MNANVLKFTGERRPPVNYCDWRIGRAKVVICYTVVYGVAEILCFKRSHTDSRKLKLKKKWWLQAENYLIFAR